MAAKGHCLKHLEINLVTMSYGQDFVTRPQRPATSDGASHLTRSDYGASPHLHLLSRLDPTIPAVRVNFGFGGLDDDQRSRRFDYALMVNWLRRRIEDSDEVRALVDFPGCDVMSYDECFPRLPAASTALEEEDTTAAEALMPVSPLTFEATGLSEEEFCDPRLRLVDDANIVCPFERPSLDDASCGEEKSSGESARRRPGFSFVFDDLDGDGPQESAVPVNSDEPGSSHSPAVLDAPDSSPVPSEQWDDWE
ncbi:hypothetical protein IWZ03DRAFT_362640 [Phyllosticta citriasiana]|uniref:Uncharacterized protein n=1 Tax=Phyllosticta citriasiana TaxID=595635 RepID=A0ABR1KCS1_9PEZI